MTVYIVSDIWNALYGVFSSRALAKRFVSKLHRPEDYCITQAVLDDAIPKENT